MESGTLEAVGRPGGSAVASSPPARRSATPAMWWGLFGVALLFATAAWRLGERGLHTLGTGLTPVQWSILAALTLLFVYGEGFRALQRRYVPHVIRRVEELRHERRAWYLLLAPLHALSMIGGSRGLLLRAWAGSAAIAAAVAIVRSMPEPWRGIVDFAVASALTWGTLALCIAALRAFRTFR